MCNMLKGAKLGENSFCRHKNSPRPTKWPVLPRKKLQNESPTSKLVDNDPPIVISRHSRQVPAIFWPVSAKLALVHNFPNNSSLFYLIQLVWAGSYDEGAMQHFQHLYKLAETAERPLWLGLPMLSDMLDTVFDCSLQSCSVVFWSILYCKSWVVSLATAYHMCQQLCAILFCLALVYWATLSWNGGCKMCQYYCWTITITISITRWLLKVSITIITITRWLQNVSITRVRKTW